MSANSKSSAVVANLEKCSVVVVDVAGTTTSVNFVKDTLFPFVLKEAESFLKSQWDEEIVKSSIKDLLKESGKASEEKGDDDLDVAGAVALIKSLTEKNSDNNGLKTLQGLIYKKGYENGQLKAHIYPDVPKSFENWTSTRRVAIYSTGTIESQKLLFTHTTEGDLSKYISEYFDQTTIGAKIHADSYKKIAEKLTTDPEQIVFITDTGAEAEAAKTAGFNAILISRSDAVEGKTEGDDHPVIKSFNEIVFESSAKRKVEAGEVEATEAPPSKVAKTEVVVPEEKPVVLKEKVEEESKIKKLEVVVEEPMEVDAVTPTILDDKASKDEKEVSSTNNADNKADDKENSKNIEKKTELVVLKEQPKVVAVEESPATTTTKSNEDEKMKTDNVEATKPAAIVPGPGDEEKTKKIVEEEKIVVEKPITNGTKLDVVADDKKKITADDNKTENEVTTTIVNNNKKEEDLVEAKKTEEENTVVVVVVAAEVVPEADDKATTKEDKKEEKEETVVENGDKTDKKEEKESTIPTAEAKQVVVVDEKENKSVLANGVEKNGKKEDVEQQQEEEEVDGGGDHVDNSTAAGDAVATTTNNDGDNKKDVVAVKKLNENSSDNNTAVSVTA